MHKQELLLPLLPMCVRVPVKKAVGTSKTALSIIEQTAVEFVAKMTVPSSSTPFKTWSQMWLETSGSKALKGSSKIKTVEAISFLAPGP